MSKKRSEKRKSEKAKKEKIIEDDEDEKPKLKPKTKKTSEEVYKFLSNELGDLYNKDEIDELRGEEDKKMNDYFNMLKQEQSEEMKNKIIREIEKALMTKSLPYNTIPAP